MTYPNNVYPADPDFPISHEDVPLGPDFYTATITYLPALVTDINLFVELLLLQKPSQNLILKCKLVCLDQ